LGGLGLGAGAGASGSGSGSGSADGGTSSGDLEKFSKCIEDAGEDVEKARKCSELIAG
jgi:hypothetical protein